MSSIEETTNLISHLTPGSECDPGNLELTSQLFEVDPLADARWTHLVEREPNSSIFHTRDWLRALLQTYGYEPKIFTLCAPHEELRNGIPFCEIRSWLTGRRLVALPFSDHCEPLGAEAEANSLLESLPGSLSDQQLKYVEIRPVRGIAPVGFWKAETFYLHKLDLRPDLYDIFQAFHKSSIQRTISRAERRGVQLSDGSSDWHLESFYKLFVRTRKRLRIPPQPIEWFRNLTSCLGAKMNICVASHQGKAIAAIVTVRHKDVITYKYGGSNESFHNTGAVSYLFWNAIRRAKLDGATSFDFGRTDLENVGLSTFKSRWGAKASELTYWRCGNLEHHKWESPAVVNAAKGLLGRLPAAGLVAIGRLLYRHIG